ncbi:hypothetical protein SAMN02910358_00743 [Lachnospiraceae bacterium XBB1006]|nr:hypothetical protein SAMN02910358_00743 [Lachnospiraceae bacterium XBB1006]
MARQQNQKIKLLVLRKILLEKTDEGHRLSMQQILSELRAYDISARAESVKDDMKQLQVWFKMDIQTIIEGNKVLYYVASREFELAEVKLLILNYSCNHRSYPFCA